METDPVVAAYLEVVSGEKRAGVGLQQDFGQGVRLAQQDIRRVTLREMLRWAYNRQQVDVLTGKTVERTEEREFHGSSCDGIATLMRLKAIGARIDGGGGSWGASADVHPDAERLHDIVLGLGAINARLVVEFGHSGTHPEPMTSIPRPQSPLDCIEGQMNGQTMRGDRRGRAKWQGEECFYRIAVDHVETETEPVYTTRGRKRVVSRHVVAKRTDVEFCPIEWWPDMAYVQAVNGIAEHWEKVLAELRARLVEATFSAHEIIDLVPASPGVTQAA